MSTDSNTAGAFFARTNDEIEAVPAKMKGRAKNQKGANRGRPFEMHSIVTAYEAAPPVTSE
jgi:hypothetical protein